MSRRRAATILALTLALSAPLLARTYTNRDVEVMRDRYEPLRARQVALAPLLQAMAAEPWVEPTVVSAFLPFAEWEDEYRAYFRRHTHEDRIDLQPTVLVMHYTVIPTFAGTWRSFARESEMSAGRGTVLGHVSVHFVVDRDGTIYQTFPLDRRCTGTYGVNHVALQIEMVARNEADLLASQPLLASSMRLARSLAQRFHIPATKVYGHYDVGAGRAVVPEYLDYADPDYPDRYPPSSRRTDPGRTYMQSLRWYLQATVK